MPGIVLLPVIPVYTNGATHAKDIVSASLDDTIIRDAAESHVMNTFLLKIRWIIVIPPNHHDPIVRLAQPGGIAIVHVVIVSRLIEPEAAITGNNKDGVRHLILIAQLVYHGVKFAVNISANNNALCVRKCVCVK